MIRASSAPPWLGEDLRAHYEALVSASDLPPEDVPEAVRVAVEDQVREVDLGSIVLYAGTNSMSPTAVAMLATSLGSRPTMGPPGDTYQTGWPRHIERLEVLAAELARRMFGARFAEVRLQSGSLANLAAFTALTEPGDPILALPVTAEGHESHHAHGMAGIRGLRIEDVPYDGEGLGIDLEGLRRVALAVRPRLIVIGASLMLFPHPVAEVAAIARESGARLLYDAAHVAGLVAAGRFQRPLEEGADLMTCSTYKSLGGPPGGLVVTNDPDVAERVDGAAYPGMTANYDAGRLASLAVAEAEVLEFWEPYADACLVNARALAEALDAEGFEVVGRHRGFTASHHVGVDARGLGDATEAARRLEPARILLSAIHLPWDRAGASTGLRIGTQEVTRWGLGPDEMRAIAGWMRRVLLDREDPPAIGQEVLALRRSFSETRYTFTR